MSPLFLFLYIFVIGQRLTELALAKRNGRWIQAQGGFESGQEHYKYIVLIHIGFLISLFVEVVFFDFASRPIWWPVPFILFLIAQWARYWCIVSLGKYWNTRIYTIPNHPIVKKGPYRWLKHPNYAVVMLEMIVLPIMFGAYVTAIVWPTINFLFLKYARVPAEERALRACARPPK